MSQRDTTRRPTVGSLILRLRQARETIAELKTLLGEAQKLRFREPNSDYYEYCNGCGRNPNNHPRHEEGCIVPRIGKAIRGLESRDMLKAEKDR